jgi:pyruvate-ferredoxin/flavodoxin oxidoreductase
LFRFNPTLKEAGENPFKLDSKPPKLPLRDYIYNETRYKMLALSDPDSRAASARRGAGRDS